MITVILVGLFQLSAPTPDTWLELPNIQLNSDSDIGPDATVPVMTLAERQRECRSSVGPMPPPRQHPHWRMRGLAVQLAILVAQDGRILNILAAPGPCRAIQDYARALINEHYRGKVRPHGGPGPRWFQTSLSFTWER